MNGNLVIELVAPEAGMLAPPVRLPASQVIVRTSHGAIIFVAGRYGPDGAYAFSRLGDADFEKTLRDLGLGPPPVVTTLAGPIGA